MPTLVNQSSFVLALILSVGSLVFYLTFAFWNRVVTRDETDRRFDFNLGVPRGNAENLFAIALVAAGTSLSTVFVFFLTAGSIYGWWLLLSPMLFGGGNWLAFRIFQRTVANGYFSEELAAHKGVAGLVPYLGLRLTGSKGVALFLLLLSVLNLLAVLVLELIVGVEVITYLANGVFGVRASPLASFVLFSVSVALLLAYVLVGGFRAVVASDVWQMKAMKWGVLLALASVIVFGWRAHPTSIDWGILRKVPPAALLWGFIVNVTLANAFAPLSQEASWQRFRAFATSADFDLSRALKLSVFRSIALWLGLMATAFGLQLLLSPADAAKMTSMSAVLEVIRTLNYWWFPLCVFPIVSVAALSAMYSTADTCVSALLFLGQYSVSLRTPRESQPPATRRYVPVAGLVIFVVSLGAYAFVRWWFAPSILQLVFSVFSNLVVIAPTVIATAVWRPRAGDKRDARRTACVVASLTLGSFAYWATAIAAIVLGQSLLWLSQLSIAFGLVFSILPLVLLWVLERDR